MIYYDFFRNVCIACKIYCPATQTGGKSSFSSTPSLSGVLRRTFFFFGSLFILFGFAYSRPIISHSVLSNGFLELMFTTYSAWFIVFFWFAARFSMWCFIFSSSVQISLVGNRNIYEENHKYSDYSEWNFFGAIHVISYEAL